MAGAWCGITCRTSARHSGLARTDRTTSSKDGRITGLSKVARLVDLLSKKLQVQERLTTEIADALEKALEPRGVFVLIEAEHLCMTMRGIKKPGSVTVTSAVRGRFRTDARTRTEALELVRHGRP